jgi:hypothetical protein
MIKEFRARKMDSSADGAAFDPKATPHDRFGFRPEAKVMISDPEADWLLIDKFFERYEGLMKKIGQSQEAADANLFRAFVTDSHRRICQQFQCQSVTFFLTVQNGKVEIAASASRQGAL